MGLKVMYAVLEVWIFLELVYILIDKSKDTRFVGFVKRFVTSARVGGLIGLFFALLGKMFF